MFSNSLLYQYYEYCKYVTAPFRTTVKFFQVFNDNQLDSLKNTYAGKYTKAYLELMERLTREYEKPEFGINQTVIGGKTVKIKQSIVLHKAFCNLLHFEKIGKLDTEQPKLLMVAPMSGHHATLLRGTVEELLPFCDVYITDWIDPKHIPLACGEFNLHTYIDYCMEFIEFLSPKLSVLSVCQPALPVLSATAIMSSEKNPKVPAAVILIGGPIDTRISPTKVDSFAIQKPLSWFKTHMITTVPFGYPGYGREVYPGFLQLAFFVSMNLERHIESHLKLFNAIISGDDKEADRQRKFYNDYFATCSSSANYYLQTVKILFQDNALVKGNMHSRGRKVDPSAIKTTALLGIEGEKDDITGVGQTKAALELCSNIPSHKKKYHLQPSVGHYGVFSGSKFREHIVPVITSFIETHRQ